MKNLILILATSLVLVSCVPKSSTPAVVATVDSSTSDYKTDFSNPAVIAGSNFGNFFLSMLRTQNYDMALKFTSKESIDKFGADKIREKYQNFKFNYKLSETSMVKNVIGGTIKYQLAFVTMEYATGKMKKMEIVVENDSCKLVLPEDLDELLK